MDEESQDAIDFKPFFDMVVGVLFILLILVAAQMFFAQWRPDAAAAPTAEQRERQRREELEREIQQFLGRLEARLDAAGMPAAADRLGRALAVPETPLRQGAGDWSPKALNAVGDALEAELSCLGQGLAPQPGCPAYRHLRLTRLEPTLGLADASPTPGPAARVQALEFAARLFRQTPGLLALRTATGGPAVDSAARIEAQPAGAPGRLQLRFSFAEGP